MKNIFRKEEGNFWINNTNLSWGDKRETIRKKLKSSFTTVDNKIADIQFRKDDFKSFHLSYDKNEGLSEIELHYDFEINLFPKIRFTMDEEINKVIKQISEKHILKVLDDEEFLIESLKMTIASERAMGGDETYVGYLYFGKSIEHLRDEIR